MVAAAVLLCALELAAGGGARSFAWAGQSWRAYSGRGALGQEWSPSHVNVVSGALVETVSGHVAGAASDRSRTFVYGSFAVTLRMTRGAGSKYALLLCAETAAGTCRPEIDWAEDPKGDTSRTRLTATLHYDGAANRMIHRETSCTCSQPTRVGVTWTHGLLRFYLDGREWARIASSAVPDVPMRLAIQTAQYAGVTPATLTTTSLNVP